MVAVSLAPGVLDIAGIRAGDRNQIQVTISVNGSPFVLAGYDVAAQARKLKTDPDPPAITATIVVTDEDNGVVQMRWDGDDVRTLLAGQQAWAGVWDMQVQPTDLSSDPITVVAGTFKAEMDVTRDETP